MTLEQRLRLYLLIYVPLALSGLGLALAELFSESGFFHTEPGVVFFAFFGLIMPLVLGAAGIAVAFVEGVLFLPGVRHKLTRRV